MKYGKKGRNAKRSPDSAGFYVIQRLMKRIIHGRRDFTLDVHLCLKADKTSDDKWITDLATDLISPANY